MSNGDFSIGNVTFSAGATVNDVQCADVMVTDDLILEAEETFIISVLTDLDSISPPDQNAVIIIASSDNDSKCDFKSKKCGIF